MRNAFKMSQITEDTRTAKFLFDLLIAKLDRSDKKQKSVNTEFKRIIPARERKNNKHIYSAMN